MIVAADANGANGCADGEVDLTTHLLQEIEPEVAAFAPIDRTHRAIGGLSVGGGLALAVAAHHRQR